MSIISDENKFIFLHVAKTGGRSINKLLMRICGKQCAFNTATLNPDVNRLGRKIALETKARCGRDKWDSYFKFAFVRNPWDRAVSMYENLRSDYYRFKIHEEIEKTDKVVYTEEILKLLNIKFDEFSFDVFVRSIIRDKIFNNYHWDKQINVVTDDKGTLILDFIGRYENLQNDFNHICDIIGLQKFILPHYNKTNHAHYSEYYNSELKKIIEIAYKDDIKMFGYSVGFSGR